MRKFICEIVVPDGFDPSDLLEQIQDLAVEISESFSVDDDAVDLDDDDLRDLCSVQEVPEEKILLCAIGA